MSVVSKMQFSNVVLKNMQSCNTVFSWICSCNHEMASWSKERILKNFLFDHPTTI